MNQILKISVDWMHDYSNDPRIFVDLDACDTLQTKKYVYDFKQCKDGTAYFAVDGVFASFMFHDPRNQAGYGGSVFDLTMSDGTIRKVKGPWSSSDSAMASLGFPETVGVTLRVKSVKPIKIRKGVERWVHHLYSGHILACELQRLWGEIGPKGTDLFNIGGYWVAHPKQGCTAVHKKRPGHYRCPVCTAQSLNTHGDMQLGNDQLGVVYR